MRKIIHIDMDAFFASVEMRDNPKLRDIPMAVGGMSQRRGVLSTSNYHARKFGVRSAMSSAMAMRLCPQLIIVKPNFQKYSEASRQVFEIFREYTPLVEGMSFDEAYLDVTECELFCNSATWIAEDIRKRIFQKTGLTASAGIAPNKLIAKLASDYKKPNGQFTVAPWMVDDFIKNMPVERIHGVGKVTLKYLHELGIKSCLDLQSYTRSDLIHYMGKFGDALFDYCRGIDHRSVETDHERKSLSNENTFETDLDSIDEIKKHLSSLVLELQESLEEYQDREIKNINVKIKYHDFKLTTIERKIPLTIESFVELFEERWVQDPRPIRLLGVGVKFYDELTENGDEFQLDLLTDK